MAEGTRKNPLEYQREYNEFMYKLKRFLASKDTPMKKLPQFGGVNIDLYLLYKTVTNFGGWMKVTDDKKWHEVAKNFNLPPSCLNSAFALRQLYVRYLEGYEKLYFLDEDGDDSALPRVNIYNLAPYGTPQMLPVFRDPQRNFERLVLSLQSGLPNEVDFAINICMLLSNVNNSVFNLTKAPAVISMILAHVGVFEEDSFGSRELYKKWYKDSGKDFLKFWHRALNCEEIKQLLPKVDDDNTLEVQQQEVDGLFNLDITVTHRDFELQRVLQVCTILHNFSFDKMDASVLSADPLCIRFLLFCLHSNIGSLKKLATDTITNLADKMVLEPQESLNSQLFFFMIDRYLRDSDRYNRICAMNVLRKICLQEENQEFICAALDVRTYEVLVTVLILEDVQLLIPSLETLYQLTLLGHVPCDCVVAVEKSIEILVSILHVCVESFGGQMLADVKIVDNFHGVAMVPNVSAAKQSPNKMLANTPDVRQRSDAESEVIAQHWLRNVYEFDATSTVFQRDLYADYVTSCGKVNRSVLNIPSFYKLLRSVYPDVQIAKYPAGNQHVYGLIGLRRKLPPGQYFMQASVPHAPRMPQGGVAPRLPRTASPTMGMETNFSTSHVPRTPTPPTRTDGLVTSMTTRPQSPLLPNQRHDVIFPNIGSTPQTVLPARPPANSGQGPQAKPSGLSASEFLGSLVDSRLPSGARNSRVTNQSIPSVSSNLVPPLGVVLTSSGVHRHKGVEQPNARLPDLVPGVAGPVITLASNSGPKLQGLPTARMPDVVSGAAGTMNGERRGNGECRTDLTQSKITGPSVQLKSTAQSDRNAGLQEMSASVAKKAALVNGTGHESSPSLNSATPPQGKVPTVNGNEKNGDLGVLYVGKEERAIKMAPAGHEVVISVVENPRKQNVEPSEDVSTPEGLVLGKKRPNSLLGDITTESAKGESALLMNGPFVASEMLRNVAKRQRRHSEGATVVNGIGSTEQKGPGAWDELVRAQTKPVATSPKLPIAVNGVRLEVLAEHAKEFAAKVDTSAIPEKKVSPKPSFANLGDITNTTVAVVVKSPGLPTSNFAPGTLPQSSTTVTSYGQSSGANTVLVTRSDATSGETSTVGVTTPKNNSPGDNPRGDQAADAGLPYRCLWSGCESSFANSKLLYNHAVSVHAPKEQMFTSCQWEGCTHVRRSRASLLFHLRQRHLTPSQPKDPNVVPKPQKASPPVGPIPPPAGAQPTTASSHGRAVFPPHPSVNPLLLNLKEQLLQTEQESPLTKSVRLTAALVLRNIARYSSSGRRKLKRFESSFTEIMCSKLESNAIMAACLHEMTRPRQEDTLPKR